MGLPEIHGFCDGGEKAYGAVMFLRWKLASGNYFCVPLMVKAFVSPLKKKSIPRLELMACLTPTAYFSFGKSEDLFLYSFSLEAYIVKLKNTNYNHFEALMP